MAVALYRVLRPEEPAARLDDESEMIWASGGKLLDAFVTSPCLS